MAMDSEQAGLTGVKAIGCSKGRGGPLSPFSSKVADRNQERFGAKPVDIRICETDLLAESHIRPGEAGRTQ